MIELHDRLKNWARYVRIGRYRNGGACGSLESRYRSPQHWHPPEARPIPANVRDADLVERAWVLTDGERNKRVIKWLYVKNWTKQMIASRCGERDIEGLILLSVSKLEQSVSYVTQCARDKSYASMAHLIPRPFRD